MSATPERHGLLARRPIYDQAKKICDEAFAVAIAPIESTAKAQQLHRLNIRLLDVHFFGMGRTEDKARAVNTKINLMMQIGPHV